MTPAQNTLALARLYCALNEAQKLIESEILPLAAWTGLTDEDPELTQTLQLAASAIQDHLKNFRLQAEKLKR